MTLDDQQRRRYSRHLSLPGFGADGQRRLKEGRVLIVGVGGLGSPAALYLAAAGVGTIGIVDFDVVEDSNLQRQVLYTTDDVGASKVRTARDRLQALNPHIHVRVHEEPLTAENALQIVADYDLVLDGTDNFPTRYLLSDACELLGKPNVYGSVFRFEGQVSVFNHDGGPTYRDLYPAAPPAGLAPSCAEAGILGILPGVVGTLQATEAIKILTGIGDPLSGRLLLYDALEMRFDEVRVERDPARPPVTALIDYQEFCNPASTQEVDALPEITPRELVSLRDAEPTLVVIDVREAEERKVAALDGTTHIPLAQIGSRIDEVPRDAQVVVHCQMGGRSAQAVRMLRQNGIDAVNLRGGLDAWRRDIDAGLVA